MKPLRIVIVGCGAISETAHLPAVSACENIECTLLVDPDENRVQELSDRFAIPNIATDRSNIETYADAAIIAVPHHLHASIASDLLARGIHILIEKPLALSTVECDSMIEMAQSSGAILSVAMPRRFSPSFYQLRESLGNDIIGKILRFEIESGSGEMWPSRSPYLLNSKQSGGGVLMANGCHDLDMVFALFGEPKSIVCQTDSQSALEANAILDLQMDNDTTGRIEISRTRLLKNKIRITGERGVLEAPLIGNSIDATLGGQLFRSESDFAEGDPFLSAVRRQLENFANAIAGTEPPEVSAQAGRTVVSWIEKCLKSAKPIRHPWNQPVEIPA